MSPREWSIVSPTFVAILAVSAFVPLAVSFVRRWRWWNRWIMRVGSLLLAVVTAGAIVNAHFDYFPTVAALLGRRAVDQISEGRFHQLELATGRPHRVDATAHTGRVAAGLPPDPVLKNGVVISFRIPSTRSGFQARTSEVYLPPAWFRSPRPHLPVIELLAGSPGTPADWTRAGLADVTEDAWARFHDGVAPIIVMPDANGSFTGDTECVDGLRGNADTYLTDDVRAAVAARFDVSTDRRFWAIGGLSEGGTCALELALAHPNSFVAACDFSGDDYPSTTGGYGKLFAGTAADVMAQERAYDPRVLVVHWAGIGPKPALWLSQAPGDSAHRRRQLLAFRRLAATPRLRGDIHDRARRRAHVLGVAWCVCAGTSVARRASCPGILACRPGSPSVNREPVAKSAAGCRNGPFRYYGR